MKNSSRLLILGFTTSIFLAGCANKPVEMYHWGGYEELIYNMYVEVGSAESDVQIEVLVNDIQSAESNGGKVPPGIYAHLGFMYATAGNAKLAMDAFTQEKNLFPESAKFIDGMMARAFKGENS